MKQLILIARLLLVAGPVGHGLRMLSVPMR